MSDHSRSHFQVLEASIKDRIHSKWLIIDSIDSIHGIQSGFCFDGPISEDQFIAHIVFFLYKNHYLDVSSRKRYGEHYPGDESADSVDRRAFDRAMKDMESRKREDDARRIPYNRKYLDKVVTKTKEDGEAFSSYHLSNIDRMAVENYSPKRLGQLPIVNYLADGRFVSSTRGSTKKDICEAYKDYWFYVEAGRAQENPEDWIERLIDLSNLESDCPPGFLYAVAKAMDERHVSRIPFELCILFADVKGIQSRFLHDRIRCIDSFLTGTRLLRELLKQYFYDLMRMQAVLIQSPLPEWQEELDAISIEEAKDYFMEKYNLFESLSFPELREGDNWTSSLVKKYRIVIEALTEDGAERAAKIGKPEDF